MLIVVLIIALMALFVIPRLINARAQARDVARMSDLNQIGQWLINYSINNQWQIPNTSGTVQSALSLVAQQGYIKSLPKDPSTSTVIYGIATATTSCADASPAGQYLYTSTDSGKDFILWANTEQVRVSKRVLENATDVNSPTLSWCITSQSTVRDILVWMCDKVIEWWINSLWNPCQVDSTRWGSDNGIYIYTN